MKFTTGLLFCARTTLSYPPSTCSPSYVKQNEWSCHQVQTGETMYSIAGDYHTDPNAICDHNINGLPTPPVGKAICDSIKPGQWLRVPPTCIEEPGIFTCETWRDSYEKISTFTRVIVAFNSHRQYPLSQCQDFTYIRVPVLDTNPLALSVKYPCQPRVQAGANGGLTKSFDCHQVQPGESETSIAKAWSLETLEEDGGNQQNSGIWPNYQSPQPGMQLSISRSCIDEVRRRLLQNSTLIYNVYAFQDREILLLQDPAA